MTFAMKNNTTHANRYAVLTWFFTIHPLTGILLDAAEQIYTIKGRSSAVWVKFNRAGVAIVVEKVSTATLNEFIRFTIAQSQVG